MRNDNTRTLTPKLRFPEFRDKPGWKKKLLRTIAEPVTEKADASDVYDVLTLSAEHGIVLQSEYFGKKVAGNDPERYIKICRDDFVYNDRTTTRSIYGTIRRLSQYNEGIVSPIYKCFRFNDEELPEFWQWYFESGKHDAELAKLVNEGARAGRFNISPEKFLSTAVWYGARPEQQKIADCLSSLDELIAAEGRKLEALHAHKKGLMQQLFPRPGETRPRLRFPKFRNAPEWKTRTLSHYISALDAGVSVNAGDRPARNVEIGVLKTSCVTTGTFDPTENKVVLEPEELGRVKESVRRDTIIMSRMNTIELVGANAYVEREITNLYLPDRLWAAKPTAHGNMRFLSYILGSDQGRAFLSSLASGSSGSMKNISKSEVLAMPTAAPSVAEQQRIATCLSALDDLIAAQTEKLTTLQTHKKGLTQQLFPSSEEDQ